MALLRSSTSQDLSPVVRGRYVVLRAPQMSDYLRWAELRALSREHLTPWEPQWSRDELTRNAFRRRVRHYLLEAREDHGYAFLIHAQVRPPSPPVGQPGHRTAGGLRWPVLPSLHEPALVGGITLSNVRRGVTQAATLGYWLGEPYLGRGLMTDALCALLPFAYDVLRLHRIEAAVMPANGASLRVLERCGFMREGLARRYLRINGRWEDHLIFALTSEERPG